MLTGPTETEAHAKGLDRIRRGERRREQGLTLKLSHPSTGEAGWTICNEIARRGSVAFRALG